MKRKPDLEKTEKVYNKIINATFHAIASKGIERTRINDIAGFAQISAGSIYYYYNNKKELLISFLDWIMHSYLGGLNKRLQGIEDPLEKIHCLIQYQKHLIIHESELEKVMYEFWMMGIKTPYIRDKIKVLLESLKDIFRDILNEGQRKQIFRNDTPEVFPAIFLSLIEGATFQYLINQEQFLIDGYFQYLETTIVNLIKN